MNNCIFVPNIIIFVEYYENIGKIMKIWRRLFRNFLSTTGGSILINKSTRYYGIMAQIVEFQ